jgi:uncharacterized peroxidase-related enzyme
MAHRAGGTVELAQQLKANYRKADISEKEMAMLEFAELLTVQPANVMEEDIDRLRQVGWSDEDVVDIVHETAMFNYMTRIADGLGIENESGMEAIEERDRAVVDTSTWGKRARAKRSKAGQPA